MGLTEAIGLLSEAGEIIPAGHPDRAKIISNHSNALRQLFDRTGTLGYLDQAIELLRTASGGSRDDPDWPGYVFNLGHALRTRAEKTSSSADKEAALAALSEVAGISTAAPYLRGQAARSACVLAAGMGDRAADAARLAQIAVRVMPAIAPRQIGRSDKERRLSDFAGLASEAASLTLLDVSDAQTSSERAARALGLLEAGRGILLSQALDTRNDLTELAAANADLAKRYASLRDELDAPPSLDAFDSPEGTSMAIAALRLEREGGDQHRLAAEFTRIVAEIRSLPGFAQFMLAPDLPALLRQAGTGPVVAINVSRFGSDALVLAGDKVTSLPLADLTFAAVADKTDVLNRLLDRARDPTASARQRSGANVELSGILEWLWDVVAEPVLDHLGHRSPPEPGQRPPRLWWMPCGLLSQFPLHAAGYHAERLGRTVLDRVISSYIPTIRALGYSRAHAASRPPRHSLIVAMPTTPGSDFDRLERVADEAQRLLATLPGATLLLADPNSPSEHAPTLATVLDNLADADIAHFACHAASDLAEPSRSMLVLKDHQTEPLTIARLARVKLDHAQLAYLSACQTSRASAIELTDESIHLASAFQLVGYPHVIGTLWAVYDFFAADIARAFYRQLRGADGLATNIAAEALHEAVRSRRDGPYAGHPILWAAFIHVGA